MELMDLEVRQEDVRCEAKEFFKTYSSFHLVTVMVCEHMAVFDMLYDVSFVISDKYLEECAEFRRRAGRRRGPQRQVDAGSKRTGWDVMICGNMDDSDESEMMSQRYAKSNGQDKGCSVASLTGEVFSARAIPTPGWRKLTGDESDQSSASTYWGDGKMGRAIMYQGDVMQWELSYGHECVCYVEE